MIASPTTVPTGYKQTDVGVIPNDWDVHPVSNLGETKRGAGSTCIQYRQSGGVRLIRINDFFQDNPVFVEPTDEILRFAIHERDLLFAGTGASAGASYLPRKEWVGLPHSYNAPRIRVSENYSKEYLLFSLHADYVLRQQHAWFVGNAQPFLDTKAIGGLSIAVPPKLAEQEAIAEALGDTDALIESLEQLVAKKRHLKQAAMQKLLTGKTRLPGFKEKWDVKRLGEIADTDPENMSSDTAPDYTFKYISLEDVDRGVLRGYSDQQFRTAPSRARRKVRNNDVLAATVRPNLLSHLWFDSADDDWICSTGFCVIRCRSGIASAGYVFQHLFGVYISQQINALLTGSNYPAINSGDVRSLEVPVPSFEEQSAITDVLSDMDAEIDAIDVKLAKARQIKQGMMQELLTGRVRLV